MVLMIFLGIVALLVVAAIILGINWVLEHGNIFTFALTYIGGSMFVLGIIYGMFSLSKSILT